MSSIRLHNSLTGRKEVFLPADPARPTMYVCGPTVYSHPHIGNARPAVVFDVLFRLLRHRFGDVLYARNVTDIEDKIIKAAPGRGRADRARSSARYTPAYHADMAALNVLPPTVEPFATAHLPQMLAMIEAAGRHRATPTRSRGMSCSTCPRSRRYGRLSRRSRDEMIDGARVEVAPYKRDPADFVLWKPSTADQPGWESRLGRGRPGWHIECSAMIEAHLGMTIDIHGGGKDLKFPHHENEIAQSSCAHGGAPLARFWLHNGFLNVEHEKMSKSIGNVLLVRDLLGEAPGEAIRYALLGTHYRKPWTGPTRACVGRNRRSTGSIGPWSSCRGRTRRSEAAPPAGVLAALEDDLNTPKAFAELSALTHQANTSTDAAERRGLKRQLLAAGALLGLLGQEPAAWFKGAIEATGLAPAEIERLIEARAAARRARDFAEADRIRDQLAAEGVVLEDAAGKTTWRLAR